MRRLAILLTVICCACGGCAVSNHGVFPKLVWYWSTDAQEQRREDTEQKAAAKEYQEQQNHK